MFGKKEERLREEISDLKQELAYLKGILSNFTDCSIGNKGVQTDRLQTHSRHALSTNQGKNNKKDILGTTNNIKEDVGTTGNTLNAGDIVNLVADFKQDIQRKFKNLTEQEFFIFSVVYSLEEQLGAVSYKDISNKVGLTESAIRDYIRSLIKKGVQIQKEKMNNKVIFLKISPELKSLVSLDNLMQLRNPYNRNTLKESKSQTIIKN